MWVVITLFCENPEMRKLKYVSFCSVFTSKLVYKKYGSDFLFFFFFRIFLIQLLEEILCIESYSNLYTFFFFFFFFLGFN